MERTFAIFFATRLAPLISGPQPRFRFRSLKASWMAVGGLSRIDDSLCSDGRHNLGVTCERRRVIGDRRA